MISFVTIGRNDDYGHRFIDRFYLSVSENLKTIEQFDIPYEYLIVEWSPIKEYLIYEDRFKILFENNKNLVDIVVLPSVAIEEGLDPTVFYEYFAKNVGIRMCKYDVLILLNSDIVIPYETMKLFVDLVKNGLGEMDYYKL